MIDAMGVIAWVSRGRDADAEHGPPRQWSSDLKLLRECGVPSEARARPSDDGCVQPRRRPHTEVRRVSTAVTTLCRGARNTANHQTGRYPPYQWFNRESATCASRQRAPRLLCRLFCCKRLALKDNDTVWYSALYHQCDMPRRTQKWFMACRIVLERWLAGKGRGWNDDIGLRGACYNGVQDVSSRSRRPAHDVQLYQAC